MRGLLSMVLASCLAATAHGDELDGLQKDLRSPEEQKAVEAATRIGEDASPRALDVALDELAVGVPPKVAAALLAGLAGRKEPRAVEVLTLYARHRMPELRKKAIVALGEVPDQRPTPVLIAALSDSVEEVRAAAARALAKRKETSAEDALVKLLAHKDQAAVDALAQIGGPMLSRKLGELIGQIPDALLANTLGGLLERADFGPDPVRVDVVKAVAKLPGADATAVLTDYVKATEKDPKRPSRAEARKALEARGVNQ